MPVPVELLRFFEKMAPGPADPEHTAPREIEDYGDAEVAAAEAAISSTHVPELGEPSVPPVPEVEAGSQVTQEIRQVTTPGLADAGLADAGLADADRAGADLAGKDKA
jgi:hypothetical protein